ncbi:hypothetical protein ABPG74_000555 [Tetrahymena malaccensis]
MQIQSAPYTYTFDNLQQPLTVQVYLYEKISNPLQVKELLDSKNANYTFLNAKLIVSLKEILIGLNRIYTQQENLTSKSLIFYLSPESSKVRQKYLQNQNKNILNKQLKAPEIELFKVFDFNQPSILVLQQQEGCNIFDELDANIKGNELPISQIGSFIDLEQIKKLYGITEQEADLETDIRGSIYNIISMKKVK